MNGIPTLTLNLASRRLIIRGTEGVVKGLTLSLYLCHSLVQGPVVDFLSLAYFLQHPRPISGVPPSTVEGLFSTQSSVHGLLAGTLAFVSDKEKGALVYPYSGPRAGETQVLTGPQDGVSFLRS